jgi:DNA repair protein RadA/Sms
VFFGEVSLSGAIRPVAQSAARLKEAQKLGFARAFLPEPARGEASSDSALTLSGIGGLADLVADIAQRGKRPAARPELNAVSSGAVTPPAKRAQF